MTLLDLHADSIVTLALSMLLVAALVGWIADSTMGDAGFGIRINSLLCFVGSVTGILLLDYVATYQVFPYFWPAQAEWVLAGILGGATLVAWSAVMKSLAVRVYFMLAHEL